MLKKTLVFPQVQHLGVHMDFDWDRCRMKSRFWLIEGPGIKIDRFITANNADYNLNEVAIAA